ncbi:MAG: flagellar biosynthetic protein FliP, partial [Bdellovibrionales bacterium]|nr:flagellar biosynthetic protein FliP [Bdellovibrionales bacterium]
MPVVSRFLSALSSSRIAQYLFYSVVFLMIFPEFVSAAGEVSQPTSVTLSLGSTDMMSEEGISSALKMLILASAVTFGPAAVLTMTCFTRIAVVLSMTRQSLGTQQMPPNMVITGLALFLTFNIMGPVITQVYTEALQPYMEGQMSGTEAWKKGSEPMKRFLVNHSREQDLALFIDITQSEFPEQPEDVGLNVAIPAFVLSELNTAFQIGFLIALPF